MTTKSPKGGGHRKRRPHNARTFDYFSFDQLLNQIAAEPRTALVGDEKVVMSRKERLLRLQIEQALKKKAREVTMLLKMMAKYPVLARTLREELVIVFSGNIGKV